MSIHCTASGCSLLPIRVNGDPSRRLRCPTHGRTYIGCVECGRILNSLGYARHRAMHVDAANRDALLNHISNTLKAIPPTPSDH